MTTNELYHTLMERIEQLVRNERVTRLRVLGWLMACLYLGCHPHMQRLGNKIPGLAQKGSKAERLRRWLNNGAVRVRSWYEELARQLLEQASQHGQPVRLLVDGTRIGNGHQLLIVALAYRRLALPIAWTWVRQRRGHSSAAKQMALLAYVHSLLPTGVTVQLAGDSEFGAVDVQRLVAGWGWQYALRQTGKHLVRPTTEAEWQRFDTLVIKASQRLWLPAAWLTAKHAYQTNLLAYWRHGEKQPWLLATNLPDPTAAIRLYSRRMWIEEMFVHFKANGFDLETVRLRHFLRLSRLTLAVALLFVWLVAFGAKTIKQGQRYFVDRRKQRQLSLFRIGYDMLERCFTNGDKVSFPLVPYF